MTFLQNLSIRTKAALLVVAIVGMVLSAVSLFFVIDERHIASQRLVERTTMITGVVGDNCRAAIDFDSVSDAQDILDSLRLEPSVVFATLYDKNGKLFARYNRDAAAAAIAPDRAPLSDGASSAGGMIEIARRLVFRGEFVGTILVRAETTEVRQQVVLHVVRTGALFLAALMAAYLLGSRLQRFISGPLLRLIDISRRVTESGDYSLRVPKESNDEVGVLCGSINDMLAEVERREAELKLHRQHLESLVAERTRDLEQRTREATAASLAKSEFLANMSHEIRTPMTAILGYADLLLQEGDVVRAPAERLEFIQTIKRNGEYLLEIINDILDLSKIEAGKLAIERIPFSLTQVLADVVSLMSVRAHAKGLELQVESRGSVPDHVHGDPTRLRQILVNLIGNAIKFTAAGSVKLIASLQPGEADLVRIDVVDTGIGIKPEKLSQLFRPFVQADSSTTRRYGGTGLGLAISLRLAHMLGGDISASSIVGTGSTFSLTFDPGPLEEEDMIDRLSDSVLFKREKPTIALDSPPSQVKARVLLAEDGKDNQRLISFHLKKAGADVEIAENGKIAVQLAREAEATDRPFDVIFMDMQMPVLDGFDATRNLRHWGYQRPIVALTAHAMVEDRNRCLDAGCDDYLTKPIDRQQIIDVVERYSRR